MLSVVIPVYNEEAVLEKTASEDRLCKWSIRYFADAKAALEGTKDAEGSYVGRVKLVAPEGMLLCVGGAAPENAVKFLYYSEVGNHSASYYIVKDSVIDYILSADYDRRNLKARV